MNQHIGVVPCRAGSKRFPGKNRAILDGKPLWKRAVTTGLNGGLDRVIVNTDDEEIIKAVDFTFYERPWWLRDGQSYRIDDVMLEMVDTLKLHGDIIHLIQCTSPFITYLHIEIGMRLMKQDVDSVQLVTLIPNTMHAFSQRVVMDDGMMVFRYPDERKQCFNSQLKPEHYAFAGYVAFRADSLVKHRNIWGEKSLPIIGLPECAIDIDTREDLDYAEYILERRQYAAAQRYKSTSKDNQNRQESSIGFQG